MCRSKERQVQEARGPVSGRAGKLRCEMGEKGKAACPGRGWEGKRFRLRSVGPN